MKGVSFTHSLYFTLRGNVNAFFSNYRPFILQQVLYFDAQSAPVAE